MEGTTKKQRTPKVVIGDADVVGALRHMQAHHGRPAAEIAAEILRARLAPIIAAAQTLPGDADAGLASAAP